MDISRRLEAAGEAHGSVIAADFQEAGRGRIKDRLWEMDRGASLPFTILLRYPRNEDIPCALTLRAGLAVSLAIEDFMPSLRGRINVKWPNDILIDSKKAAGILCEAQSGNVHLGIGINTTQDEFPPCLKERAVSIAIAAGRKIEKDERFVLLEKILEKLFEELEKNRNDWKPRLEKRLYKKGEEVTFKEGFAGSPKIIKGVILGIGEAGELLIVCEGETEAKPFYSGEISFETMI